jgi:hypothetical protein
MRKLAVFSVFILVTSTVAVWAGPREDTLSGISRCASLPDDRTFLDCIYGAVQPMRARLGRSPALPAQQRLVPPADPSLTQTAPPRAEPASPGAKPAGGLLGLFSDGERHMTAYSFDKRGLFTVTLSDGSVWRQDPNDTNFAHFGGKASNYAVTLVTGEFGKSRMSVRGEAGPYLVEQVR